MEVVAVESITREQTHLATTQVKSTASEQESWECRRRRCLTCPHSAINLIKKDLPEQQQQRIKARTGWISVCCWWLAKINI